MNTRTISFEGLGLAGLVNQTVSSAATSAGPGVSSAFVRWWTEYQQKMRDPKLGPSACPMTA